MAEHASPPLGNPMSAAALRADGTLALHEPPEAKALALRTVSWPAVFAGALAAAALSLILLVLGAGVGLSSVSPWRNEGIAATTLSASAVGWLTLTQLAASGLGGYLAGRLRIRWVGTPVEEVRFRDTTHGLLTWSLATLVSAALLSSTIGAIVGAGSKLAATGVATAVGAGGAAAAAGAAAGTSGAAGSPAGEQGSLLSRLGGDNYPIDKLMRPGSPAAPSGGMPATGASPQPSATYADTGPATRGANAEVALIYATGLREGSLRPEDTSYLTQLVGQRTGLAPADAQRRVTDTFNELKARAQAAEAQAREAADQARKASAYAAMWMFISLLAGALFASVMALLGGRQRDRA